MGVGFTFHFYSCGRAEALRVVTGHGDTSGTDDLQKGWI